MSEPGYRLDPTVWRSDDGSLLIGGSDFTIVELDPNQSAFLDALLAAPVSGNDREDRPHHFTAFLLTRNLIQPNPGPAPSNCAVALVVPCHNDDDRLGELLGSAVRQGCSQTVVVDDGSAKVFQIPDEHVTGQPVDGSVTVLRHDINRGAGAARQTGWQLTDAPLVLFVDADVVGNQPVAQALAKFFDRPTVGAVSARIVNHRSPTGANGLVARYEDAAGSLDLGDMASNVAPRTRVPYVPTACLMVRRSALASIGGFDPAMRLGEDVDLCWRLVDAGWEVRHEPSVEVGHHPRPNRKRWFSQRITYGRSNADLAVKHPRHVAALEWTGWNALPWTAAASGGMTGAVLAVVGLGVGVLPLRRSGVEIAAGPAVKMQLMGARHAGEAFVQTTRRSWFPLAIVAAAVRRRFAVFVLFAAVAPAIRDWVRDRPGIGLPAWVGMRLADDVGFGTGVWLQSIRRRSFRALRVHWSPLSRFLPSDVPAAFTDEA